MESGSDVAARLEAGNEIEVSEIVARLNELEAAFEDRGFLYIAINGWLIPDLDGSQEARELMFLRAISEHLDDGLGGRVFLTDAPDPDKGMFVCRLEGRYVPDGNLYSVTSYTEEVERTEVSGARI